MPGKCFPVVADQWRPMTSTVANRNLSLSMIFEHSLWPMVASLIIAALCLTFGIFQAVVAVKRPEFPWNKWGAGAVFPDGDLFGGDFLPV
jgi:hypothetical protein